MLRLVRSRGAVHAPSVTPSLTSPSQRLASSSSRASAATPVAHASHAPTQTNAGLSADASTPPPASRIGAQVDPNFYGLFQHTSPIFPSPLPLAFVNSHHAQMHQQDINEVPRSTPSPSGGGSSKVPYQAAAQAQKAGIQPVSDETLRTIFTNDLLYPQSGSVEQMAVLRTSIDAGLALRAGKLFDGLYNENRVRFERLLDLGRDITYPATALTSSGSSSGLAGVAERNLASRSTTHAQLLAATRLSKRIWDDLLHLFLFKAAAVTEPREKNHFFHRAQALAERLIKAASLRDLASAGVAQSFEPAADAYTGAVLVKGYARVLQSWPTNIRLQQSARDLIVTLSRVGITMSEVATSQFWYLEPPLYEQREEPKLAKVNRQAAMGQLLSNAQLDDRLATMVMEMEVVLERLDAKDVAAAQASAAEERGETLSTGDPSASRPTEQKQSSAQEAETQLPALHPTLTKGQSKFHEGMTRSELMDPEYQATPLNLAMLQQNLNAIDEARSKFSDPYMRQKWLEDSALESARKRLKVANETMSAAAKGSMDLGDRQIQLWMWDWFTSMQEELKSIVASIQDAKPTRRSSASQSKAQLLEEETEEGQGQQDERQRVPDSLQPLLKAISTERLALIPVLEIMALLGAGESGGLRVARACGVIGKSIEKEYHAQQAKRRERLARSGVRGHGTAAIDRDTLAVMDGRDITQPEVRDELKSLASARDEMWTTTRWSNAMQLKMGSFLLDLLTRVALIRRSAQARDGSLWNQRVPAFYTSYQYVTGRRVGVIKLNNYIMERLDRTSLGEVLHPRQLPMLVPPRPWVSHNSGGYFTERKSVMRLKDSTEQGSYLRAAAESGELDKVLSSLDVLGQTAWKVNVPVLKVVSDVWNSGEALGDLPPRHKEITLPPEPEDYHTNLRSRHMYNQLVATAQMQQVSNHSQRCDTNYKLEIARAFAKDKFYFPHNIDFRGRAYPIPPNFNHMGNDMCRGLLKFDKSKPLGAHGLRWLRIHVANVYGFDKASLSDREQWTLDHMEQILDSARHPLDGSRWWLGADDAWQCLAACMELNEATTWPEGPEAFPSSLPVHQDGTCNGLQHYAALGGDLAGAQQVNLAKGEKPADVYTGVAELVIDQLHKDANEGSEIAQLLKDKITRKVVKQTVMTTVYGVTFIGAKAQIKKQLIDKEVQPQHLWSASHYLARVVLTKIGHLFAGATSIQRWLHLCARLIAKSIPPHRVQDAEELQRASLSQGPRRSRRASDGTIAVNNAASKHISMNKEQMTSVIWTTALGLPVVQPYRRQKKRQMGTKLQSIFITDPSVNHEVSPQKQASAFPPNFVHSLDATHMMMTALEAHRAGLVFASVHDSYWTHAADVDTLSDLIRETFVLLHSNDILANLRQEFLDRFGEHVVFAKDLETCLDELEKVGQGQLPESVASLPRRAAPKGENPTEGLVAAAKVSQEEAARQSHPKRGRPPANRTAASSRSSSSASLDQEQEQEQGQNLEPHTSPDGETQQPTAAASVSGPPSRSARRFVPLKDLFPPLPPKGSFDVKEIRSSLYFFS